MITEGKVVSLAYTLTSDQGDVLDQATAQHPFAYLHGHNQIVPGLENALEGKEAGFRQTVVLSPDQGYGPEVPQLRTVVDRAAFPPDMNPVAGQHVRAQAGEDSIVFLIEKVEGEQIHLNGNHPLAGQTLHFDVEVLNLRDATTEELEHGHAHTGHEH